MATSRKRHRMTDDIREALLSSRLWDTYRARPPYQQNDYIGWIQRGAREETRAKRIAQMLDELTRGNVYMKMKWGATKTTKKKVLRKGAYHIKNAPVRIYGGEASWYFATLPARDAEKIQEAYKRSARGWGSLPVTVTLRKTTWKTSIFPDNRSKSYLLPLKKEIRVKEHIDNGDTISFQLVVG